MASSAQRTKPHAGRLPGGRISGQTQKGRSLEEGALDTLRQHSIEWALHRISLSPPHPWQLGLPQRQGQCLTLLTPLPPATGRMGGRGGPNGGAPGMRVLAEAGV